MIKKKYIFVDQNGKIRRSLSSGPTVYDPGFAEDSATRCKVSGHDGISCSCPVKWKFWEEYKNKTG